MVTLARKQVSINIDVMDLLNKQIEAEQQASSAYLAMASWADQNGYVNTAKFFYAHSLEEREHMMKIFKFVNENGGAAFSPTVGGVNHEFESLKGLFEAALEHEIAVTKQIHELVFACREAKDLTTELFLNWFVEEQAEEENEMREILDMIELMDDAPRKVIDDRIPTK